MFEPLLLIGDFGELGDLGVGEQEMFEDAAGYSGEGLYDLCINASMKEKWKGGGCSITLNFGTSTIGSTRLMFLL